MNRVAKRVLTGLSLVVAVGVLLYAVHLAPTGLITWPGASLFALLSVWELGRMQGFRGLGLTFTLGVPAVALVFLSCVVAFGDRPWGRDTPPAELMAYGYLTAGMLASATFGGERLTREVLGLRRGWVWALVPAGVWVAALLAFGPSSLDLRRWQALVVLGALAFLPILAFLGNAKARSDLGLTVGLALWCVPPLFGLILIDAHWGVAGLGALITLSKVGDMAAYFVGRASGKRHPFPHISPNKTVAGCVASLVAGVVFGFLLVLLGILPDGRFGALGGVLAGLTINVAAQASDLSESWVKRRAGVKDSGTLVGAAGGVLDVVDSMLLTVPVSIALWPTLFAPS